MRTLLLADDSYLVHKAVAAALAGSDFRLVIARNGWQAVELADGEDPDIILMDVSMPVLDGIEAVEAIRTGTWQGNILMLTGERNPNTEARASKAGAQGYILKEGMNSAELRRKIELYARRAKL